MVADKQNSIERLLLRSILRVLVGQEQQQFYEAINWQQDSDRFCQSALIYPHYYTSQDFHGIARGYLNPIAAITYDPVTALASPPHEPWIRRQLIAAIQGQPQQILDLGCGKGSATLMLKQAFPAATVTGLDLSTYMLVVAAQKAHKAGFTIQWQHGLAEATGLPDNQFDLVTASFLLHETPPEISQSILQECFRVLKPKGQVLVLDGNQQRLRHANWLIQLFREPYSKVYAAGNVQAWIAAAGFAATPTKYIGWLHQLTSGIKQAPG